MKIIAELANDKCLVEISNNELANLLNFYSQNSSGFNLKSLINKEINISSIYEKYRSIHDLQTSPEYNKARAKLKKMLNALKPIEDLINDIKLPEEIK